MPGARHDRVRKKFHILVDGELIPAPIKSFREMKLPPGTPATDDTHSLVYSHHFATVSPFSNTSDGLQRSLKAWKRKALSTRHRFKFKGSPLRKSTVACICQASHSLCFMFCINIEFVFLCSSIVWQVETWLALPSLARGRPWCSLSPS